jgi:predicted DsbA family dithiol-disulfide isomerase
MQVEIWSDVVCPWCGIGNARLQSALRQFGHADDVTLVHRSFQLDENAPTGRTRPVREILGARYGMSDSQLRENSERLAGLAAAEGFEPYVTSDNHSGNTQLAHELLAHATEQGLADAAWERLYRAYFAEVRSVFDVDALVALGAEIGLDADATREVLTDRRYRDRVLAEGEQARQLGATGVPFVVVDRRYGVAGAQPTETFVQVLERAWADSHPAPVLVGTGDTADGAACGIDGSGC